MLEHLANNLHLHVIVYTFLHFRKWNSNSVKVTDSSVLNPGDDIIIFCNLTKRGNENSTSLRRISWYKDGKLLESVRYPDPDVQQDFIAPLKVTKVGVQQGGNYTCLLSWGILRSTKLHMAYLLRVSKMHYYMCVDSNFFFKKLFKKSLTLSLEISHKYCLPYHAYELNSGDWIGIGLTNDP